MAGSVKDIVITNIVTPATILTATYDFVDFEVGWVRMLEEATDKRLGYSWGNTAVQKIVISPRAVAYPGDATPGEGSKKLTIVFLGGPATVVMSQVEVDLTKGWLIIYKGDHLIAYNPSVISNGLTEPS